MPDDRLPLITREIVRRYLTAIGAPAGDVAMVGGLLLELHVAEVLDVIVALPEGPDSEFEVHEALVLCAVAEQALGWSEPNSPDGVTCTRLATSYLDRAGIALEDWEATR